MAKAALLVSILYYKEENEKISLILARPEGFLWSLHLLVGRLVGHRTSSSGGVACLHFLCVLDEDTASAAERVEEVGATRANDAKLLTNLGAVHHGQHEAEASAVEEPTEGKALEEHMSVEYTLSRRSLTDRAIDG